MMFCLEAEPVFAESEEDVAKAAQDPPATIIRPPLKNKPHFGAGPDDNKANGETSEFNWNVLVRPQVWPISSGSNQIKKYTIPLLEIHSLPH